MSIVMLALLEAATAAQPRAADAESVLAKALREHYPAVVQWEIHAFAGDTPPDASAASIVRLGSRSAVRVGPHLYWYTVAGFEPAVHATRAIPAGESLEPTVGEVMDTDVLAAACDPVTDVGSLRNTRARRVLRADQVICKESIEPRPPVARGDDVTVRYLGERVSITARATAQSDGAFGDEVVVKSQSTERVFSAVVSGEREVAIHE